MSQQGQGHAAQEALVHESQGLERHLPEVQAKLPGLFRQGQAESDPKSTCQTNSHKDRARTVECAP